MVARAAAWAAAENQKLPVAKTFSAPPEMRIRWDFYLIFTPDENKMNPLSYYYHPPSRHLFEPTNADRACPLEIACSVLQITDWVFKYRMLCWRYVYHQQKGLKCLMWNFTVWKSVLVEQNSIPRFKIGLDCVVMFTLHMGQNINMQNLDRYKDVTFE